MAQVVTLENMNRYVPEMANMFIDRKRVFIDILKWDLDARGSYELDQFDDDYAEYIIVSDPISGDHLGSIRLLRTDRPHILDTLFSDLCVDGVPCGRHIREVTRLCLSPRLKARDRLQVRNRLFTALVEYGLLTGITGYTGVAEVGWYSQLLALGWRCTPLGFPKSVGGSTVGAVLAHIEPHTIELFRQAGTYETSQLKLAERALAA